MMKKSIHKLSLLTVLSLIILAAAPAAYASTLTVTLNPTAKTAQLRSDSTTNLVLTYPASSDLSKLLRNETASVSWSGSFNGTSDGARELEGSFDDHGWGVRVQNMTVDYSLNAKGNLTTFVLTKTTSITASVMGVFRVVNGTVHADLGWKAFVVPGQMSLTLDDHPVEVNQVGSTFDAQFGDHPIIMSAIIGMFANYALWHRPTLNFSALDTPLSTWTRSYNSLTNSTNYSKTITGQESLTASADYNGQKYSLSVKSDPSANVDVQGYAVASGDTLQVQGTPLLLTPTAWIGAAAVGTAAIAGALYLARRSRTRAHDKRPSIATGTA